MTASKAAKSERVAPGRPFLFASLAEMCLPGNSQNGIGAQDMGMRCLRFVCCRKLNNAATIVLEARYD
jgi:hypothetical protein